MQIKVMTYNILNGGVGREQAVLDVIKAVQPDIVVLQEAYTHDFLEYLGTELNMAWFFATGNRKRRVALLSRLPMRVVSSYHPAFKIWRNVAKAEIEYHPGKFLHVVGIHPKADLGIVSEGWRWWEAGHILECVTPHLNEKCLLAGDFNAIAPGDNVAIDSMPLWLKGKIWLQGKRVYRFSMQRYRSAGLIDCFRYLNEHADGFTLPPPHPNSRLDYIFVSPVLKPCLRRCWVVREPAVVDQASDHYPVVAEFEL